ncbi:MAG: hypothetical protein H6702_23775 [Myxococcales bacterium]|nr:hypothetical protein [Myxococcales bacterium]
MRLWIDTLWRPPVAARRVLHSDVKGFGHLTVLGLSWAALMALLALAGHQPSATAGLAVPPARYYAVAAAYVLPLCLLLGEIFARVAAALAGADPRLRRPLRVAFGAVVCTLFVWPDLLAFAVGGFEALGTLVRITAPITALALLAVAGAQLHSAAQVAPARALLAATVGLLAQALVAAPLLR